MNSPHDPASATNAALLRAQAFMTPSPVPSISTELLVSADGELNRELHRFLFDPPSNPELLKGKKIAICCSNGVEEVEITGAMKWLSEHGATVHVVAPRIGEFHPTLGLRFPPLTKTHVLAIRLMENAGWLKIDCYMDEAKIAGLQERLAEQRRRGMDLGEIFLQTGWTAYCADSTLRFAGSPEATHRWPFYALGFLICQIPLARIARREEEISFLTALRSIVPMGMYVSFCLYPHQLEVYRWMLRLVTF